MYGLEDSAIKSIAIRNATDKKAHNVTMIPNRLIQFRNREASILGWVGLLIRLYVSECLTAVSVPFTPAPESTGYFPAVCISL